MILCKRVAAFAESGIDGEAILMHLDRGDFHSLTGVGLAIWQGIDGVRTLGDVQAMVADRYAVDRETCAAEVAAFVAALRDAGLVDAL